MEIYLIRHGETEWSRSGRHTGRTDVALTPDGESAAKALAPFLQKQNFSAVWTSPLARASNTAALAGFPHPTVDPDLAEWHYGIYEGRTTLDIRKETPEWSVWLSPIVNGESLEEVADRARRVIDSITHDQTGDVAIFAHGHILRILAACWINLPPITGRYLALDTATISVLGYERQTRVIRHWNQETR